MSDAAQCHYIQWPCRPDRDLDARMELVRKATHDDKSGVVRQLLLRGIADWENEQRTREAWARHGLDPDKILPYLGRGKRDH